MWKQNVLIFIFIRPVCTVDLWPSMCGYIQRAITLLCLVSSHGSASVSVCIGALSEVTEKWQRH